MYTPQQLEGLSKEDLMDIIIRLQSDALTGFLRREAMNSMVQSEEYVVAMIDINGLKVINDRDGHIAGDKYIQKIASHIRTVVRPTDRIFRYGGDEFVIVFNHATMEEAESIVARMDSNLMSIGLGSGTKLKKAIDDADKNMYLNKTAFYERKAN